MMKKTVIALILLALFMFTGCSTEKVSKPNTDNIQTNETDEGKESPETDSSNSIIIEKEPEEKVEEVDLPITISFAGDTMMDWSTKKTIRNKGPLYPFQLVKEEVEKSDFALLNLETAVTTGNSQFPKQYNFKSDPESITGMKAAGFDLVSLANNHTMDFNEEGLLDTFKYLKQYNMPYIGAGMNSNEAFAAHTVELKGKTVKFLAFSRVLPVVEWKAQENRAGIADGYDLGTILEVVEREKQSADYVLLYLHWGKESKKHPEPFQRDWAKQMIDSGADAIIGSHSHVLQGFEYYKDKPIAYSLGNFLFPDYVSGDKAQTGLLTLTLNGDQISMNFNPYYINDDQIKNQSIEEKQLIWSQLQDISYGVTIDDGEIKQKQ